MIRSKKLVENPKGHTAVVWAHGGGGVFFNADTFLHEACRMSLETNCIVFNVDYRKAPEHKCPMG